MVLSQTHEPLRLLKLVVGQDLAAEVFPSQTHEPLRLLKLKRFPRHGGRLPVADP